MSRQCAARMFRISIHAPLRGRPRLWLPCARCFYFNPRPLAGATGREPATMKLALISIHAPLRGRPAASYWSRYYHHFNPRPLAGATQQLEALAEGYQFQSTPPCGGDGGFDDHLLTVEISIHAPLRGRPVTCQKSWITAYFNPRPLAGATC